MGFSVGSEGDKLMEQMSKDIATSKSSRVIIPVLHIYIEHVLEKIIRKTNSRAEQILGKEGEKSNLYLIHKAKILYATNILNDEQFNEIKTLNTLRNEIVHTFEPKKETIEKFTARLELHPYSEKRDYRDRILTSGINLMSQLCEFLE